MNPLVAYAIIGGLGGFGNYLMGGAERKYKEKARGKMPGLEKSMLTGITPAQISSMIPMMRKSIIPFVNKMAGGAAAKYGSRSGIVLGKSMEAFNQAMTGPMANLYRMMIMSNMANLRTVYGQTAATARG